MNFYSLLLACFIFFTLTSYAQKKDRSIELYDLGNIEFAKKDYGKADSLFTLSLKFVPHPDTYYNRAVCRRRMNDFSGYCVDLGGAANMGDSEAYKLYSKECVKIDTIFVKNDNSPAGSTDFEYATFITRYSYNKNLEYEKYDRNGIMILAYNVIGRDTVYLKSKEITAAKYKDGNDSLLNFIKTNTGFGAHVIKNRLSGQVKFALTINEKGEVKKVKTLLALRDGSTDSLAKAFYALPAFDAAKYFERNVKYQSVILVAFSNGSLTISEPNPHFKIFSIIRSIKDTATEIFSKVETMPDFAGGMGQLGIFLQKNLNLPLKAKEAGLSGKCFLRFVIGADGNVYNVEVLKGVPGCPECDAEAVRVVKAMPKWKPGTQNGRPVPVFFNLPINFELHR